MQTKKIDWTSNTILIVEDVETNLMFIKAALARTGIHMIWAKDGWEAINQVKENPNIDIVLMDLRMPNLDGFKATEIIKTLRSDLPVIAQTTFTDQMDKDRVFEAGCDDYLAKPIRLDQLLETVEKYMDN